MRGSLRYRDRWEPADGRCFPDEIGVRDGRDVPDGGGVRVDAQLLRLVARLAAGRTSPARPAGEDRSGDQDTGSQRESAVPSLQSPERRQSHPRHPEHGQTEDVGRIGVHAVVGLVGVAAGDQPALLVEGHQPVQQQAAGHLRVVDEQDLAGAQLGGRDGVGDHHVAGVDPGGHRAAGHHVRGVAGRERGERGQDEPGQHDEAQDDNHASHLPHPARARRRTAFYPGHGTFRASQVKVAVDRVLWASLSSTTE